MVHLCSFVFFITKPKINYFYYHYLYLFNFEVSLITKGKQMIPVLNHLDISAACIGNHDLGKLFLIFLVQIS